MAGEGFGGESGSAYPDRRISGEPLPRAVFPQRRARGGPRLRTLLEFDCQRGGRVPSEEECFRDPGSYRAHGCPGLPAYLREAGRRSRRDLGRLRYVSNGQHPARLPHVGFVALSRNRDFDAGVGGVSRDHDGRAHTESDERARPSGVADERGRSRPGGAYAGGARNSGSRRRTDSRRDRADGGEEFETDGAHGRVFRRRSAAPLSRISHAARRMELGRLSAADERGTARVGGGVQLAIRFPSYTFVPLVVKKELEPPR